MIQQTSIEELLKGLDKKTAKDCEYAGKNEWGPTTDCNHPKGDGFCSLHHCPKNKKVKSKSEADKK